MDRVHCIVPRTHLMHARACRALILCRKVSIGHSDSHDGGSDAEPAISCLPVPLKCELVLSDPVSDIDRVRFGKILTDAVWTRNVSLFKIAKLVRPFGDVWIAGCG